MIDRFPVSSIRLPGHGAATKHHDVVLPEEGMKAAVAQAVPRLTQPYAGLSDKLLDAKLRLHQRLLEDTNLSALEKLSEEEIRQHVSELVAQYILTDNLSLNSQEFEEFVTEVLNEMTGLG